MQDRSKYSITLIVLSMIALLVALSGIAFIFLKDGRVFSIIQVPIGLGTLYLLGTNILHPVEIFYSRLSTEQKDKLLNAVGSAITRLIAAGVIVATLVITYSLIGPLLWTLLLAIVCVLVSLYLSKEYAKDET